MSRRRRNRCQDGGWNYDWRSLGLGLNLLCSSSVVLITGTVLVVKNVFVDVSVNGIVDFVDPIEIIFDVTADVVLVTVKIF